FERGPFDGRSPEFCRRATWKRALIGSNYSSPPAAIIRITEATSVSISTPHPNESNSRNQRPTTGDQNRCGGRPRKPRHWSVLISKGSKQELNAYCIRNSSDGYIRVSPS